MGLDRAAMSKVLMGNGVRCETTARSVTLNEKQSQMLCTAPVQVCCDWCCHLRGAGGSWGPGR